MVIALSFPVTSIPEPLNLPTKAALEFFGDKLPQSGIKLALYDHNFFRDNTKYIVHTLQH